MTEPPANLRTWHKLSQAARAVPSRTKERIPRLTPADLAVLSELIEAALADAVAEATAADDDTEKKQKP